MHPSAPFQLTPEYRDYLWGGQRLRPGRLTAEAWVVYAGDFVAAGPLAGRTLAEVAAQIRSACSASVPWRTRARASRC